MEKENEQAACNGDQYEAEPVEMDEEVAAKEKLTSADPNKVKFTSVNLDGFDGKNGEAKVDIHVVQTSVGMGKDELMKYANEPFWVRLRMILFVLFWVSWIAMLVGAIIIILLAPRCPPAPQVDWYQKTSMYQMDVKTFQDSDNDGIGDFKGLISKLDYFKDNKIGTLLLSAFYKAAPDTDGIVAYNEINSQFGTMADFEELVTKLKEKDLKLVIDFDPTHSSDEHEWFQASINKEQPYSDFYIWEDSPTGDETTPPNNWLSVDGGSAWKWNNARRQFYLHTFSENQPDLNLRNELVKEELKKTVKFWLGQGVDGLKVVAASHLVKDEMMRDEPLVTSEGTSNPQYKDLNHIYTVDQAENVGIMDEWVEILENFTQSSGIKKILLAEVSGTVNGSLQYYGNGTSVVFPVNIELTQLNRASTALDLKFYIDKWTNNMPENAWPFWMIGSKYTERLASRIGSALVDGIHMVSFLIKGTPITYFGDELGLPDTMPGDTRLFNVKKPVVESVMVWSNESFGGFTNGTSSLVLNPDYETINVQVEKNDKHSHLNIFSGLLGLRDHPAINFGLQEYPLVTKNIFSMIRVRKGLPGYLVALNMGTNSTTLDFTGTSNYLPETAKVEFKSKNIASGILAGDHPKVNLNAIPLDPQQAVVFSFVPQFEG